MTDNPLPSGRSNLIGQRVPGYLVDLAWAAIEANKLSKAASELPDTAENLAELVDAETMAQQVERLYLEELADWRSKQTWAVENAREQQLENFVEVSK
jgi:hypothetical protein